VRKINIDTDIRLAMTAAIREFLAENPEQVRPAREYPEAGARRGQGDLPRSASMEFGRDGQGWQDRGAADWQSSPERYASG
jgi:fructose-bisphosphate aldolase class II